jgi:hypothetical protein
VAGLRVFLKTDDRIFLSLGPQAFSTDESPDGRESVHRKQQCQQLDCNEAAHQSNDKIELLGYG